MYAGEGRAPRGKAIAQGRTDRKAMGMSAYDLEINRHRTSNSTDFADSRSPLVFHQRMTGYVPARLHDLSQLAELMQVRRVLAKDETLRFGLPSFKILGASWAVYRALSERVGTSPNGRRSLTDLREELVPAGELVLVTATDGNHGRAVARVARLLGLPSRIFVPTWLSEQRKQAIESEGAWVTRIEGSYDEAVKYAADLESERCVVISDTSWPGYTMVPSWIVEGYSTIFWEIDDELADIPSHVVVQIGVGSLAAAVVRHYHRTRAAIIGVEPQTSPSLMQSARKGSLVSVQPRYDSVMSGLNCGVPSRLAWPMLRNGVDAFVAIEDGAATKAVRLLATMGLGVGEAGAAGLAGLLELLLGTESASTRRRLRINGESVILLLLTEGSHSQVLKDEDEESSGAATRATN